MRRLFYGALQIAVMVLFFYLYCIWTKSCIKCAFMVLFIFINSSRYSQQTGVS